ncbi:hypothetical protein ERICIV_02227 [Paenibacillus larvae subsp. larvae]|uniref:Uncharacterized protein n=6 Tax=root TaxID=1 RepID=A0A345AVL8_9CAUD|nr:hypothetical protein [Paenibacillus larvae]YP_010082342.1 hypothetical protein KMD18_gp88 [Paenibacillus phage Halcyone]YP_010082433.1 hypothetical protein KMD19_gp89 [Paenibacillus phage Scottie]YP_010082511.1 hypothetical protein KMD20_gp76 [Paenibacillus phage Unity]AXF41042.1 hypothetical protein HEATH_88 [Paenibacillus phage Heath]AQT83248.1 hypothetical protein B1222_00260 [Paenibacillus larvae subsp. pulvifaciens]AQZ48372.1 hypothetical protein B5S25_19045 [Paenibacillus larvae subs
MRNYIRNHYRNCPRHTREDREFMKVMTEKHDDLIVYDGDVVNKREAISLIKRGLQEPMAVFRSR